jgi:DNA-binding NtrC family response regulator
LVTLRRKSTAAERQRLTETCEQVGLLSCLIVAARPGSAEFLAASANQWGWETFVCTSASAAKDWLETELPQLAFVDLQGPGGQALRAIVEQVSSEQDVLLVVGGHENDLSEEVWARQLGVWFYVPGLKQTGSVGLLCRDARSIVERKSALEAKKFMGLAGDTARK